MKNRVFTLLAALCSISLIFSQCSSEAVLDLEVNEDEKKVDVVVDGKLFTSYIYPEQIKKPVLWPLMSPAGNMLTRSFPLVIKEGDRSDHPHHVGVWLNYGDVNGLDFWNNSEAIAPEKRDGYGTVIHRSIEKAKSGKGTALLETSAVWESPDHVKMLEEQSSFTFSASENLVCHSCGPGIGTTLRKTDQSSGLAWERNQS
jgi:hypothetical protein